MIENADFTVKTPFRTPNQHAYSTQRRSASKLTDETLLISDEYITAEFNIIAEQRQCSIIYKDKSNSVSQIRRQSQLDKCATDRTELSSYTTVHPSIQPESQVSQTCETASFGLAMSPNSTKQRHNDKNQQQRRQTIAELYHHHDEIDAALSAHRLHYVLLTHSTPAVPNCWCSNGPALYWSNTPGLIFDIRTLWRSVLSARASECQKLKLVG